MQSRLRLFLIAGLLALGGSLGSVAVAAAELLLLVPIAAYHRTSRPTDPNFRTWLAATGCFILWLLLFTPFAYPWDTLGLLLFSPLFGLVAAGLESMIAGRLRGTANSRQRQGAR